VNLMLKDQRGSVGIIVGLTIIPLVFAAGMGIDYAVAARARGRLNAAADAAVLAAITPSMMTQSDGAAAQAAKNAFVAQVSAIKGLQLDSNAPVVNVSSSGLKRTVQISYSGKTTNAFSSIYGQGVTKVQGSASSSATAPANIDFYMLLDSSPSMAIAATTAGINTMVANTSSQGGCAFGCHEQNPGADNLGNPGGIDNYTLARNLGVTLRMDNVAAAVKSMTTTAQQAMTTSTAKYRMAIYTFDYTFNTIQTLNSDMTAVQNAASNIQLLQVYKNNCITSTNCNSDTDTNYDAGMTGVNNIMSSPGGGTNATGDTPQEVLFLVTDGVEDEMVNGSRQQSLMSTSWCTTIKNKGIRIAVLYTTYFPLPTNGWYNSYIAPFQPNIGPNMQSCASPGLYFEVTTNGDISAAMNALFTQAVATAHLTN
jgi:hypothetical protein